MRAGCLGQVRRTGRGVNTLGSASGLGTVVGAPEDLREHATGLFTVTTPLSTRTLATSTKRRVHGTLNSGVRAKTLFKRLLDDAVCGSVLGRGLSGTSTTRTGGGTASLTSRHIHS